jgi:hypothetical protein
MSMQQCPTLAAMGVEHRHQDFRREATRVHAANVAAAATLESHGWPWMPLKASATRVRSVSAHQLSDAVRRVAFRLSAASSTIGTRLVH